MYNITIISMFKNESLILNEWIQYYVNQGIEHFYLIDNGSDDDYYDKIKNFKDKITLIKDKTRIKTHNICDIKKYDSNSNKYIFDKCKAHTQLFLSNKYFLEKIKKESTWTMFIDCDEYIYIPKTKNLNSFLKNLEENSKFDNITDIFIPWKLFGSNNLKKQPKSIIIGFNKRIELNDFKKIVLNDGNVRGFGKSISKTKDLITLDNHECQFSTEKKTLLSNFDIVKNNDKNKLNNYIKNLNYTNNFIFCNHYRIMSHEYYFNYKIKRSGGSSDRNKKNKLSIWKNTNKNDIIDNTLINLTK